MSHSHLRTDNSGYPPFVMAPTAREADCGRERVSEYLLAVWMRFLDPNVLGVRRIDEELEGAMTAVLHIAIPLNYGRKDLARTLSIKELAQSEDTPRVNLVSSVGRADPHSFIRVRMEDIIQPFCEYMVSYTATKPEVNDHTMQLGKGVAEQTPAKPEPRRNGQENGRLQATIIQAMAVWNAELSPDQIEILMDGKTGEHWIRILRLDPGQQSAVQAAIRQVGIRTAPPSRVRNGDDEWMVLFPAAEARKLTEEC